MKHEQHNLPNLSHAFHSAPSDFTNGVEKTLNQLQSQKEVPVVKKKKSSALIIAFIILLALTGVVYAVSSTPTADSFGLYEGEEKGEAVRSGHRALIGQSTTLGDVVYTMDELVYSNGKLYGTATARPLDDTKWLLIPYGVPANTPVVYSDVYTEYGMTIPANTITYEQLAKEKSLPLLRVHVGADSIRDGYEEYMLHCQSWVISLPDNALQFTFEAYEDTSNIQQADRYRVGMIAYSCPVAQGEENLRIRPLPATLSEKWRIDFIPEEKE